MTEDEKRIEESIRSRYAHDSSDVGQTVGILLDRIEALGAERDRAIETGALLAGKLVDAGA